MRIEYHRTLIADRLRNAAFHAALKAVIVPGKSVVADIGAGTGLLGLMAARLGAREVYLYETGEIAGVAEAVLKANKIRNAHVIPVHSTELENSPQVDIVVSETLGNYALEEDIVETLNDARRRSLKPGGLIIPRRITQFVAPVTSHRFAREFAAWDDVGFELDFAPAKAMSHNNVYVRKLRDGDLLGGQKAAVAWDSIDLLRQAKANRRGEARWTLQSAATVHGFAVWWMAELTDGISLSTAPGAPATHWEQLYYPIARPIAAIAGETISIALRSRSSRAAGTHLAWTACHLDKAGRTKDRQAHDLDKGYLP